MATVYPPPMPTDIKRRTATDSGAHNGRPGMGSVVRSLEDACIHLASRRPVGCPASINQLGIVAPATVRKRIAVGLYDLTAACVLVFASDYEAAVTISVVSGTDPVGITKMVVFPRANESIQVVIPIAIGTGVAQAPTFDTVEVTMTPVVAGPTPVLLSWTLTTLPTMAPYQARIVI